MTTEEKREVQLRQNHPNLYRESHGGHLVEASREHEAVADRFPAQKTSVQHAA